MPKEVYFDHITPLSFDGVRGEPYSGYVPAQVSHLDSGSITTYPELAHKAGYDEVIVVDCEKQRAYILKHMEARQKGFGRKVI